MAPHTSNLSTDSNVHRNYSQNVTYYSQYFVCVSWVECVTLLVIKRIDCQIKINSKKNKCRSDSVHATPGKFQSAAFFLRLGLPSTLIRHESAFQTKRIRKLRRCVFVWTKNIFETELSTTLFKPFGKRWRHDNMTVTDFSQSQIMTVDG